MKALKTKPQSPAPAASGCPIVGVGASAGGLEAYTQLLMQLPLDTGFGFVLVQHLDPQHDSALTQLLARTTAMPVCEATHNLRVQANKVYIIPPNTSMGISRGRLKLQPRKRNGTSAHSIDFFFEALAHDQQERAVGVILSGNASDGTIGLEAIKAEGGLTFAQDDSARYDSMPRSAIAAGCVDSVLSPTQIARELARIAQHPYVAGRSTAKAPRPRAAPPPTTAATDLSETDGYKKILLLLRNHSGVDFSHYKSSTVHRRMTRRAVLNHRESLESYADFLRGNEKELDALYSDSLISVTSFFRNADAFAALKAKVLPKLLAARSDDPVRVWVLGCSSGQEAYSIAMLFTEAAEKSHRPRQLQIFATDLSEANLERARHGLYPKSITSDVSPERLRRFFVAEEGGYRVIKSLREQVVFARHNLISDPPFSRMDLITCRNVMIYFEPSLQKKALPAFHYALKPEGYLFLGASESVSAFIDLFSQVDKRQKIFAKKAAPNLAFHLPLRSESSVRLGAVRAPALTGRGHGGAAEAFRGELNAEREADRVTVNQFAPPSVLINEDLQILQFRGPTGLYLEPPTGKARFDLLKMARDGLMLPLRATINRAKKSHQTARKTSVEFKSEGKNRVVHLEVVPLKNLKERRYLVLFEDPDKLGHSLLSAEETPARAPISKREEASRIASLEQDLAETRDYLQSIQEHQEAANEELQASNEEGQSANEELQSLNEELETSKEELESTNEELTTVNEEMVSRNAELNRLNGDLTNLQTSTKLVILLLGRDLTIRRFSAQAEKQFNLHASDLGRFIGGIRHNLDVPDLETLITEVITTVRECEREVQTRDGHWYSLRVRPYLTLDNKVDGAVLVLVDIDVAKQAGREVARARDFAEAVIDTMRDPLLILDVEFRVQKANESFFATFKASPENTLGHSVFRLGEGNWNLPSLRKLLREILPRHNSFNDFEVTHDFARLGRRTFLLHARMLSQDPGHREKILLGFQDITQRRKTENALLTVQDLLAKIAVKQEELVIKRTKQLTSTNKKLVSSLTTTRLGAEKTGHCSSNLR
ncbi:MAG: CheR family methyltransferase [Candidatus Didemnitutus sp.]|nr:CheR family methyltransferase [Candidatus Didemnitutus sp.]